MFAKFTLTLSAYAACTVQKDVAPVNTWE